MCCRANTTGIYDMADVLILGGGLAGCSAALALADRGISATIIEARARLGGRAFSRALPGDDGPSVEYGGGWGHAGQPRVQALAARLGVALVPRAGFAGQHYLRDGAVHETPCRSDEVDGYEAAMAQWRCDALAEDPAVLDLTLAAYFAHRAFPAAARREVLAWWAISGSTDPCVGRVGQLLGAKLAKGWGPKVDELGFTFAGGVQGLAAGAAQASGANVILSDPAERLGHGPEGVHLRLTSGCELSARAAIVALPVNALNQIRFDPALPPGPAHVRATGHAGRAVKLLIRARGVPPGHLVTGEAQGLRFLWSDHIRPDGSTLIIAFALADDVPEPSTDLARAVLARAFPDAEFLSADWHDWLADPFARGTWVGPVAADEPLFAPESWGPFGRVAFAGADIAAGSDQGWFEGAIASAERAAALVASLLVAPPHQRIVCHD
jgi:monoamine oxidase